MCASRVEFLLREYPVACDCSAPQTQTLRELYINAYALSIWAMAGAVGLPWNTLVGKDKKHNLNHPMGASVGSPSPPPRAVVVRA